MKKGNGTGFAAPTIGVLHPKGSTIRKNADGTVSVIPPKKSGSSKKSGKK